MRDDDAVNTPEGATDADGESWSCLTVRDGRRGWHDRVADAGSKWAGNGFRFREKWAETGCAVQILRQRRSEDLFFFFFFCAR